jgi:hypothetical protein
MWKGEHQVKIAYRWKRSFQSVDPFLLFTLLAFGTMSVTAGVVRYLQVSALVTLIDVLS